MNSIIERHRRGGPHFDDVQLARLSPAIHEHILINGRYHIDPDHAASGYRQPSRGIAMPTYH
jgi:hypothetical protein